MTSQNPPGNHLFFISKKSSFLGQKDSKRNLGFPALLSSNQKPKDNGQSHVNLHFAKDNLGKDAPRT